MSVDRDASLQAPVSDLDLWSDEVLLDPYPCYRELRDLGPVVWLSRHKVWVATRHAAVRQALANAEVFTSRFGISMNPAMNQASEGIMLVADDPEHRRLRRVFTKPLNPMALEALKDRLQVLVQDRVETLLAQRRFDAVCDLAHFLPLTVVTELVGFSADGKRNMLRWAAGLFNGMGPDGYPRTLSGLEVSQEALAYVIGVKREDLDPEGWGSALFRAADDGELSRQEAQAMLMDYLGPALDTTINGLSSALLLLARNPEQWDLLRAEPNRVPGAIDEALRLESPIRAFTRVLTRDFELEGVPLRAGDRIVVHYACANRDERRYADPDRFDITRDARDHVAFGFGTHMCAGMHLGKLEIGTVLNEMIARVRSMRVVEEKREPHNTLRGLARLVLDVEPA